MQQEHVYAPAAKEALAYALRNGATSDLSCAQINVGELSAQRHGYPPIAILVQLGRRIQFFRRKGHLAFRTPPANYTDTGMA